MNPPDLMQRSPEESAARMARGWLEDARRAAARLEDASDDEALHDFRVALRRLRSSLRTWRRELAGSVSPGLRRRLAAIQRETGPARDAEVALPWLTDQKSALGTEAAAGIQHLVDQLEARHLETMDHARRTVRRRFEKLDARLDRRLRRVRVAIDLDRPAARLFGTALARKLRRAGRRLDERLSAIDGIEDRAACHAARIAAKRLRYLIEPLGEPADACRSLCKDLQDELGELNDAHVLAEEIASTRRDAPGEAEAGLAALAARVAARAEERFARLERDWLSDRGERLAKELANLADHCESEAQASIEIERKYLLRTLPDIEALRAGHLEVETLEIEQGWLPGQRLRERIRRTRNARGEASYRRTMKLGAGVTRVEIEEETTRAVFDALWPLTEGCRIRKLRHRVREGDLLWEIDDFLDRDLALAEVELPDAELRPEPPAWLDVEREVTDDPRYTNLKLAR